MADPYGGQKPGCIDPHDPLGCFGDFMVLAVAVAMLAVAGRRRGRRWLSPCGGLLHKESH
jgi:NaMN:DMB phosphoribosyltransferase